MIGERIRERRQALGLTQARLAAAADIDAATIHRLETGKHKRAPHKSTLALIERALDLDLSHDGDVTESAGTTAEHHAKADPTGGNQRRARSDKGEHSNA